MKGLKIVERKKACISHENAYIKRDDIHTSCMHQKIFPLSNLTQKKKKKRECRRREITLPETERGSANRIVPRVSQWGFVFVLDHIIHHKKRASWVGFTTPGKWVPPPFNKPATSAYLSRSSAVVFRHGVAAAVAAVVVGSPSSPPSSVDADDFPLGGAHGWPNRVPLVRNSWAR